MALVFLALGLVYLNFAPSERWAEQRTTFRSSPLLTIFWILSLLFVQVAPFIDNDFLLFVPYYVFPTLGTSLLVIGTGYWLVWAKVLPAFGYHIQHEIVQMPDGSERVKYKVSPTMGRCAHWRACLADVLVAEGQAEETEETRAVDSAAETVCLVKRVLMVGLEFLTLYCIIFPTGNWGLCCHRQQENLYGQQSETTAFPCHNP